MDETPNPFAIFGHRMKFDLEYIGTEDGVLALTDDDAYYVEIDD